MANANLDLSGVTLQNMPTFTSTWPGAAAPWPASVTTPTPTQSVKSATTSSIPTTTTAPAPKPSAPSNSNGNVPYSPSFDGQTISIGGKIYRSSNGLWQEVGSSGGDYDFDSLYRPQLDALMGAENTARSNADLSMQDIDTGVQSQLRDLTTEEDKAKLKFQADQTKASQNRQSAYEDAVRYRNALVQQKNARFGGGSSAGEAVGELGNQEFYRNQGNIEKSYADIFGNITNQTEDFAKTVLNTKLKIDEWSLTQKNNIRRALNESLTQIGMAKGQLESDKASKKLEVLDRARALTEQIQAQEASARTQLNQWKEQQMFLLQNNLIPKYSAQINTSGYAPQTNTIQTNTTTGATPQIKYNPSTGKWTDEFGNIVA